ncbi:hypothetical protein [Salinibacter ruber]|uniref:hypothetical protein n=1 Tax=Salinibacter ruber TaxID=146919 RepID=UPI00207317BE|nr:hypothetical protein [Salinibacter ruber]
MCDLYLHIGTHKTGSTAIQGALRRHSRDLKDEGILRIPTHHSLLKKLMRAKSSDPAFASQVREELAQNLNSELSSSSDSRLILSYEGLSGHFLTGYSNTEVVAETLRQAFDDLDVEVIVYLRRQDDFVESMYTQMIYQGEAYSFDQFISQSDIDQIDWYDLVNAYGSKFGADKIHVRRYHRKFLPEPYSLIQDFGRVVGSEVLSRYETSKTANSGYSRTALEIARRTNPYLDDREQSQLRGILQASNTKKFFESYSFFAPDERRTFLEQHASSNRRILDEYFPEQDSRLFPKPDFEDHKEWEGLTVERTAITLTRALLAVKEDSPYIVRALEKIERKVGSMLNEHPRAKRVVKSTLRRFGLR